MANHNTYSPAAAAYAKALIELSADAQSDIALGEELEALAQAMASDDTMRTFFSNPSISPATRWTVIQKSLGGRSSTLLTNFLGVANRKNRLPLIGEISAAYRDMLDRKQNRVRVELVVASRLQDDELAMVQRRVSSSLGKTAIIEQKVDATIIGGLVLRVHDKVIDGSVKAQLEAMRKQLLAARAKVVQ